jgi:hypothetical protein
MAKIKDLFKAYLLKDAKLIGDEEYPLLEYSFVSKEPPKSIIPFNKIRYCTNPSENYVCFYCRDEDFIKLMNNPKRYVKYCLNLPVLLDPT